MRSQVVAIVTSDSLTGELLDTAVKNLLSQIAPRDESFRMATKVVTAKTILTLDRGSRTLTCPRGRVAISFKQMTLLHHLASSGRVWTYQELGYLIQPEGLSSASVRTLLSRLRKTAGCDPIDTVRYQGYAWNPAFAFLET